jgi:two-component system, NtrC family, sensor kinase
VKVMRIIERFKLSRRLFGPRPTGSRTGASRFFNNLQFRVATILLLVSLVPLGIVSLFAARTADYLIRSMATNQLENVAAEKQELLERWIAERKADLEVVTGSDTVRSMDPSRIGPYITLVQSKYGAYKRFIVAGADGNSVFDSAATTDAGLVKESFKNNFGISEANPPSPPAPLPRAASGTMGEGSSYRTTVKETWFDQAMQGRTYLSEVALAPEGKEAVFELAAPIAGADAAPRGAVCAVVSTQAISARVLRVSLGETGECYLVDKAGTFLAHNDPARILKDNIAQSGSFSNIGGDKENRPIYNDYRGIPVLGASRAVQGTGWYVVVEQDRDEAFAGSDRLTRSIYIVIAVTAAAAVGFALLLSYYVSSPIRALSEAAHALSRGDFENALAGAKTIRSDEIGALHVAFRHMAGQLWDRHANLEKRVGLTEEELRKTDIRLVNTLKAAARSEHLAALGRLAAGVAHEIRTPLTSLKLFLQSARDEIAMSPEHAEDLHIALKQVRRIENTINHFLDFARPREPLLTALDFQKLIDDALEIVLPRANQQEIEVISEIAPELPKVEGDMRQLGEALVNLMANALDAMPEGGRLAVSASPDTLSGDGPDRAWVRIDISDTGSGIREDDTRQLFEPFYTTKASGSGLGLAIVQGTVQRHGGTITVRSRPGEGTTFSIRLPAGAKASLQHSNP